FRLLLLGRVEHKPRTGWTHSTGTRSISHPGRIVRPVHRTPFVEVELASGRRPQAIPTNPSLFWDQCLGRAGIGHRATSHTAILIAWWFPSTDPRSRRY